MELPFLVPKTHREWKQQFGSLTFGIAETDRIVQTEFGEAHAPGRQVVILIGDRGFDIPCSLASLVSSCLGSVLVAMMAVIGLRSTRQQRF